MRVPLERKVLNENDRIAAGLRERWQRSGTFSTVPAGQTPDGGQGHIAAS